MSNRSQLYQTKTIIGWRKLVKEKVACINHYLSSLWHKTHTLKTIKYVSDLVPHMEITQIWLFYVWKDWNWKKWFVLYFLAVWTLPISSTFRTKCSFATLYSPSTNMCLKTVDEEKSNMFQRYRKTAESTIVDHFTIFYCYKLE